MADFWLSADDVEGLGLDGPYESTDLASYMELIAGDDIREEIRADTSPGIWAYYPDLDTTFGQPFTDTMTVRIDWDNPLIAGQSFQTYIFNDGNPGADGWQIFQFYVEDGDLAASWYDPVLFIYHDVGTPVAYDPDSHRYLQWRIDGTDLVFEYSGNGTAWTEHDRVDITGFPLDECGIDVDFQAYDTDPGDFPVGLTWGFFEWDGVVLLSDEIPAPHALAVEFGGDGGLEAYPTYDLGPRFSGDFTDRWESGLHLGDARPNIGVQVRRGRFNRKRKAWTSPPDDTTFIRIYGVSETKPWQATWEPQEPYVDVPNVLTFEKGRAFNQGGLTTATLVIENIVSKAVAVPAPHHTLHRGYLAPLRGYVGPGRTALEDEHGDEVETNEWYDVLRRNAQITVTCGYGDETVKTFTGLIDDVDWTSSPDTISITMRCFGGKQLADTPMFGWSKDPEIRDPVIFIDDEDADEVASVGLSAASSGHSDADHKAANVLDSDNETSWRSNVHGTDDFTEWVEITVPQGRYTHCVVNPEWAGMDIYVSVMPREIDGDPPELDGTPITADEWYDGSSGVEVPGDNGGHVFVFHDASMSEDRQSVSLGGEFRMGDDSIIRVSVRDLHELVSGDYYAGITAFVGRKRTLSEEAKTQQWVRVQDVSDIVKCILRWAGFKEWEVETTGVPLSKRLVCNRQMMYRDVIKLCEDAVGYEFFMQDPSADSRSIGVPTFRKSRIVTDAAPLITVTDDMLLSEVRVALYDGPLAYIIRVRGRESKEGVKLGADRTRRLQFTLRPPWSGVVHSDTWDLNGGIHKRVIHTNHLFKSMDDCRFGAYYIALKEAIESAGATVEIPAHPSVQLDHHVELLDLGTGITSRLSVRELRETFQAGEEGFWKNTFVGALVDVPNIQDMVAIINADARSDI